MAPNVSVTPKPLPAPKHAKTMQTHLRKKFVSSPLKRPGRLAFRRGPDSLCPLLSERSSWKSHCAVGNSVPHSGHGEVR